jgi:hypothetical protein
MEKHHSYNNIIESKLEHLPAADVSQLWTGMMGILDERMPEKKRKRRFFGWFTTGRTLAVVASLSLFAVAGFAFNPFTSKKTAKNYSPVSNLTENTTSISSNQIAALENKQVPASPAPDLQKSITDPATKEPVMESPSAPSNSQPITEPASPVSDRNRNTTKNAPSKSSITKHESSNGSKRNMAYNKSFTDMPNLSSTTNSVTADAETGKQHYSHDPLQHHLLDKNTSPTIVPADVTGSGQLSTLLKNAKDSIALAKKAPYRRPQEKGAHIGLLAGLDLSAIQFKSFRTGSNKGIIAGYSFNNRISVETGLFWNKKKFFGEGSDFHPDHNPFPAGVQLLSVLGSQSLYEIPLNIKYTILPDAHRVFVTAGFSSYFTKTENYNYEYEYNGQFASDYRSYKNQSKDWFSVANFSLGYSHRLGGFGSVRVEPYLKLPLGTIGINNMRVVSTGLNVGFTRKITK